MQYQHNHSMFLCSSYQQNHVGVGVDRSREADPLLLSATEVDASFANLGRVAVFELLKVAPEVCGGTCVLVLLAVERQTEENVVTNGPVLNPGLLADRIF